MAYPLPGSLVAYHLPAARMLGVVLPARMPRGVSPAMRLGGVLPARMLGGISPTRILGSVSPARMVMVMMMGDGYYPLVLPYYRVSSARSLLKLHHTCDCSGNLCAGPALHARLLITVMHVHVPLSPEDSNSRRLPESGNSFLITE